MAAPLQRELERLLRGHARPSIGMLMARLSALADELGVRAPSRASIYNFMPRCRPHQYSIAALPSGVRAALYNLSPRGRIPGHQLAFYAFQYGDLAAACFASNLPWIDLFLADRMRGWRPRTHGLLQAVLRRRAIA